MAENALKNMKTKKTLPIKKQRRSRLAATDGSDFVRLKDVQIANLAFIYALDRAIRFHRTNTNDPHNVGNAVMVALAEVRDAFKAYIC